MTKPPEKQTLNRFPNKPPKKTSQEVKKEIKSQNFWDKYKIALCSVLACISASGIATFASNYNSIESQNNRTANQVIHESFGDKDGINSLVKRINDGNIGQFPTLEVRGEVARDFEEEIKVAINSKRTLTAPQIKKLIPQVLNSSLSKAGISGFDPNLQSENSDKIYILNNTTFAATFWEEQLNPKQNNLVQKYQQAKQKLQLKIQRTREQWKNKPTVNLDSISNNFGFVASLNGYKNNGKIPDLHLVGITLYHKNSIVNLTSQEITSFKKLAGKGESHNSFNIKANGAIYCVEGSVIEPSYSNSTKKM